MARLQILVHKSYHPYLEKNKQKVREDERKEEDRLKREEERVQLADSEARLALLRGRADSTTELLPPPKQIDYPTLPPHDPFYAAGPSSSSDRKGKGKARERDDMKALDRQLAGKQAQEPVDGARGKGRAEEAWEESYRDPKGHLNFWAGEEKAGAPKEQALVPKKTADETQADDPTTMYLSRPIAELEPWYVHPEMKRPDQRGEGKDERERYKREKARKKEERSKTSRDPLTLMNSLLSSRTTKPNHPRPANSNRSRPATETDKRLDRETSERARALALVEAARKKRGGGSEAGGSTPALSLQGTSDWGTPREREYQERRFFPESSGSARRTGRKW